MRLSRLAITSGPEPLDPTSSGAGQGSASDRDPDDGASAGSGEAEAAIDLAQARRKREALIERAARRVATHEGEAPPEGGTNEFVASLLALAKGEEHELGGLPGGLGEGAHQVARRSRLLDLLSTEIVRLCAEAPSTVRPDEALETLAALQHLRDEIEPAGSGRFASRLAEPDGIELVIELAHDLRSPLTSILLLSETLRSGHSGAVSLHQQRQLGLIYSAALGLISVASDVMELAKGGARLAEEQPVAFPVSQVLDSVREMVQPMAEEKGLTLRVVPPQVDHRRGLPMPLSRVLLNLTTNALKFTDEGLVEIVARETSHGRVQFSVRDSGRGIDESALERLFEPFRPGPRRGGHLFSGTGLGLSIARRLVEAMGSTLEFESHPGLGTRFYFELALPPASEF